jgi:hypothetical protein
MSERLLALMIIFVLPCGRRSADCRPSVVYVQYITKSFQQKSGFAALPETSQP